MASAAPVSIVRLSEIRFNPAVYPRKEGHDPATVERYAADIEAIEAAGAHITIAADGDLLDGRHRHLAYLTRYAADPDREVPVKVVVETSDAQKLLLAVELNSRHGLAFTEDDRKHAAISLYNSGFSSPAVARALSVSEAQASYWLSRTIKDTKERQNEQIEKLWLACYTDEEISEYFGIHEATGEAALPRSTVRNRTAELSKSSDGELLDKSTHSTDFKPPLYNVWKQQEKSNAVGHFGNSEATWLDNLLYLYTEPFDIVVDPFAGGGSTIDVCRKRKRRYWVSDRKPKVSRDEKNELGGVREHDLVAGDRKVILPALNNRWGKVQLVYLDPPYWKQSEGKYSSDPTDLANMPLVQFTATLAAIITKFSEKLKKGAFIAMLLQPTQWNAPEHQYTDHVVDMIRAVKLPLDLRIQCPYESQQATAQMVEWAKENKKVLVLSRELVIWRID